MIILLALLASGCDLHFLKKSAVQDAAKQPVLSSRLMPSENVPDAASLKYLNASQNFSVFVPPTNWKNYQNSGDNFKISFPPDWTEHISHGQFSLNSPANEKLFQQVISGKMYGEGYDNTLNFYYFPNIADVPDNQLNNMGAKSLSDYLDKAFEISKIRSIKLGEYIGYRADVGGLGTYDTCFFEVNGHIYELAIGDNSSFDDPKIQKILGTAQF